MFIPLPSSLLLLDISHSSPNGFNSWGSTWYCSDPPQIHERFVEEYCASIFMMVQWNPLMWTHLIMVPD